MLNFKKGEAIANVFHDDSIKRETLYIDVDSQTGYEEVEAQYDEYFSPILRRDEREITYIAGPSGSGKSTITAKLAEDFHLKHPKSEIYFFSRTKYVDDPAFDDLVELMAKKRKSILQIDIDQALVDEPIDITAEIPDASVGTLMIFDDVTTINDDKIKKAVEKLMADVMEIGRKLKIWIIITSHLIIPNDKKIARTLMNELHSIYVFPKSGASQQISYAVNKYLGLGRKQDERILELPSRWVKIYNKYPKYILYETGAYTM